MPGTSKVNQLVSTSNVRPPQYKYGIGEYALSFHGPLLYRAKILKREMKASEPNYFVHYQGWNKKWDEWIIESRMLAETNANKAYQKELKLDFQKNKKKQASSKKGDKEDCDAIDKHFKRDNEKKRKLSDDETEDLVLPESLLYEIPPLIKRDLIQDWQRLSHPEILHQLPCSVPVEDLLDKYKAAEKQNGDKAKLAIVEQIVNGIRDYFNSCCGKTLLYKCEVSQYQETIGEEKQSKAPSTVYGYTHLVRLLVKLPYLLAQSEFQEEPRKIIGEQLTGFLRWLSMLREADELVFFTYVDKEQNEVNIELDLDGGTSQGSGQEEHSTTRSKAHGDIRARRKRSKTNSGK